MKDIELVGKHFGRLTVLSRAGSDKRGEARWSCMCTCGNTTIANASSLKSGNTMSCGCISKELLLERNQTHGLCKDKNGKKPRLYNIWVRMRQRCCDANSSDYARYGGRGISVCSEWSDFMTFYNWAMANGYKNNLSIERENVNGNYEPTNCSWITLKDQARNKRNSLFFTYKGEKKTLTEWSEILGLKYSTLRMKLRNGETLEKLFDVSGGGTK